MKLLLRILPVVIIVIIAALTIVFANRGESNVTAENPPGMETPSPSPSPTPDASPSPEVFYDPLSGLPLAADISGSRPYAVMLDNIKTAQPLLGISKAGIIYEIPVEGGITRMMALFQDVAAAGAIGSVRSARPYFVEIAQGYGAVYIHAGGSPDAYSLLKSSGISHVDGVNGSRQDIFYRDKQRRKELGYEHSLVTSGELISEFLPTYGIKLEHPEGFDAGLTFSDDTVMTGGQKAADITAHFPGSKTTAFKYDAQTGLYGVYQFNKENIDGDTGLQLCVSNVLILRTDIYNIAGDKAGRLKIDVTGTGSGTFCRGGEYVPITWTKPGDSEPFSFAYESGAPLVYGRGITYICVISDSDSIDFGQD